MPRFYDDSTYKAVKVRFKKFICEDDFPDRGMTAWLIDIVDEGADGWKLYFDFTEFELENRKYFKRIYPLYSKNLADAIEMGYYDPKYSVYVGCGGETKEEIDDMLNEYLIVNYDISPSTYPFALTNNGDKSELDKL